VNRRGTSLIEALVALTLTCVVALLAWSILRSAAFRLRDRSERFGMEHSVRAASAASRALLEPLGRDSTAGPDLALPAPNGFVARAVRGSGVLCAAGADSLWVRAGTGWWLELRAAVVGRDSLMIGTVSGPDRWAVTALDAAPAAGRCPDRTPALTLRARISAADLTAIGAGSPLRVFEPIELLAYASGGAQWLGLRGVSSGGSIQPLAGPFSGVGLAFSYFSRTGTATTLAAAIVRADLVITGLTERATGVGMARVARIQHDSMSAAVLLRNAP
jgi:hypothetical protein